MPDQEHDDRERARRERQYQIDVITFRYAEEHRAGRAPRVEEYAARYPEYAAELTEFALYFHAIGGDLPAADAAPAAALSPAAAAALARIQASHADQGAPSAPALDGLVAQAARVGLAPRTLAEAVRLSTELLARLEAHSIDAATIPGTLVRRLASALKVAPDVVSAYLGATGPAAVGAFYYADQAPERSPQQSFLEAVQASALAPDLKREWAEIAAADAGEAP